jgi:uroporphyrinogen decarboxylase
MERIHKLGPGGGYIISDSNSVPAFCKTENIVAMSKAVEKYRYIY